MRQIETQKIREYRKKRNQMIVGITLILVIFSSIIGFATFSRTNEDSQKSDVFEYNGIEFTKDEKGFWQFEFEGTIFNTIYNPKNTENIEFKPKVSLNDFVNKPLYYITDSYKNMDYLLMQLGRFASRNPQEVCLESGLETIECKNEEFPVKTCEDNVIIMITKNETKTYKDNNCIFIEAPLNEQISISDKLIFSSLGIE